MTAQITHLLLSLTFIALTTSHAAMPIPNGAKADLVLGQPDFYSNVSSSITPKSPTASTLCGPSSVVVDPITRKVFVADLINYRILRYPSAETLANGAEAEFAFGQFSLTERVQYYGASAVSAEGLFIDSTGRLWVADGPHNRVLMFNAAGSRNNSIPDKIFGQPNATTFKEDTTATKMSLPSDVCVDTADRLWVADRNNNRVLRFDSISTKASGAAADGVLGQNNFTTRYAESGPGGIRGVIGVTVSSSGALYVTCDSDNRVLRFDNAAALTNGAYARAVLGQSSFYNSSFGLSANQMCSPSGAWITADDSLWVTDSFNNRLLRFDNASTKPSRAVADGVVGQTDFVGRLSGLSSQLFRSPRGKPFVDTDGRPWMADFGNNRVLRFSADANPPVIDRTAPLLTLSGKVPVSTKLKFITLKGTASDASGISRVQYRIGSGPLKPATGTTAWNFKMPLKKGKNVVTIIATDVDGMLSIRQVINVKRK